MSSIVFETEEISDVDFLELSQKSSQSVFLNNPNDNDEEKSDDPDYENSQPFLSSSDCSSQEISQVKK